MWHNLSISLSFCLSIYLSICKPENQAILPDFFIFQSWQHQKRSNSARLPQRLNLTTSKTKRFCETSSFFQNWQHQTRSNSARLSQCLNLPTSKTKQVCETSSFFEVDNIKNEGPAENWWERGRRERGKLDIETRMNARSCWDEKRKPRYIEPKWRCMQEAVERRGEAEILKPHECGKLWRGTGGGGL